LDWECKTEDTLVVIFVSCFERAYLGVSEMIIPSYAVVKRCSLCPSGQSVMCGWDKGAARIFAEGAQALVGSAHVVSKWERVSQTSPRWSTVEVTDEDSRQKMG